MQTMQSMQSMQTSMPAFRGWAFFFTEHIFMPTGLNVKSTKTLINKTTERIDGRNAGKYKKERLM
jgi:hypothetical protein